MGPKRVPAGAGGAPKRQRKAPEPKDFRAALIFFRGDVTGKKWAGTWVAWVPTDDEPMPSDEQFDASPYTFQLWFDESLRKKSSTWEDLSGVDMGGASVVAAVAAMRE